MQKYLLIVGIGNQGPEYAYTFHNAGILAVEYLSKKYAAEENTPKWKSARSKHFKFIQGRENSPIFIIPTDVMNESGHGIKSALAYFNITLEKILVLHDDADLPLGELKISTGQGSAGHKGIASIIDVLGTKEFARARIGIRSTRYARENRSKAGEFVLKKMTKDDLRILKETFEKLAAEIFGDS